LESETLSR